MTHALTIGKDESRQIVLKESGDYTVTLAGEGANAEILGAFWLKGNEKLELNVVTIHAAKHTSADTFIRAIADDTASATINGTIIVEVGAQQTNSFLTENVLLFSPKAQAHAIPNLEIEANDVKCSHAATVGSVNEEQLFYLMSRGITREDAKKLIAEGFLDEVKKRIKS
jgi:Fe-S cluster assembly protein SufD